MGFTRVRLTLDLEIRGDVAADACTYFIGRFGNYRSEDFESPVEEQVEYVILDMLGRLTPELVGDWQITSSRVEAISKST